MTDTTSQAFFEQKYKATPDPWNFGSSSYELMRYDAILNAMGDRHFAYAFEPGCSVGVLTEKLAQRCDRVDAMDISPTAVAQAKQRCQELTNTYITCDSLSQWSEQTPFDLLIFSEIGYYFEEPTLRTILRGLVSKLAPSGLFVACHWLGHSPDHILTGDRVHEVIAESHELVHQRAERHANFRLDCWSRR